jgi:hypothetical protein
LKTHGHCAKNKHHVEIPDRLDAIVDRINKVIKSLPNDSTVEVISDIPEWYFSESCEFLAIIKRLSWFTRHHISNT